MLCRDRCPCAGGVDAPFSLFFTFTDAFTQFLHQIGFTNAFTTIQYRIEPTRASTMARCGVANTPAALPPDRLFSHRTNRRPPPCLFGQRARLPKNRCSRFGPETSEHTQGHRGTLSDQLKNRCPVRDLCEARKYLTTIYLFRFFDVPRCSDGILCKGVFRNEGQTPPPGSGVTGYRLPVEPKIQFFHRARIRFYEPQLRF